MGFPFHGSPLVPPPLSPVPSEYERNLPTSLKGGEGRLGRIRVRCNGPHPSGEGRGKKKQAGRWHLEVVVVDEPKINRDRR